MGKSPCVRGMDWEENYNMPLLTQKDIDQIEDYYYWMGDRQWYRFPETLRTLLMDNYGPENPIQDWTEQDIYEGSRKIIFEFFSTMIDINL